MLWAKVLVPVVMTVVGSGAAVAAVVTDEGGAGTTDHEAAVWIDGPSGASALPPGTIPVTAHATADTTVTGLDLYVDGEKVAADHDLERTEKLFFGELEWDAAVGPHELVVRQVGGTGEESRTRQVVIADGATAAEDMTTTTTSTTTPGETTTSTAPGETTTTAAPDDTTTTPPVATDPGGPPATEAPPEGEGTVPPGTDPPDPTADDVVIDSVAVGGGGKVYVPQCVYSVEVQARVRNADYAQVMVRGTGFNETMTRSGSSFTLTIPSGVWSSGDVGTHDVVVIAGGGGASAERVAGTVEIIQNCPKD